MGRGPKEGGSKRGAWTAVEDNILTDYITAHGEGNWRSIPKRTGLKRCGKSCRLRWLNYLRPDIKRGNITRDEEDLIFRLHRLLGNRWSLIAGRLPGRTDNEIKNYWNSYLSKRARDELKDEHNKTSNEAKIANDEPKISTLGTESKENSQQVLSPTVVAPPPQLLLPLPEDLLLNLDFAVNANVVDNLSPTPSMSREGLSSDIAIGMMPGFFEPDFSSFDDFGFDLFDLVLEGNWRSLQGVEEADVSHSGSMDYTALSYTSDQWIM